MGHNTQSGTRRWEIIAAIENVQHEKLRQLLRSIEEAGLARTHSFARVAPKHVFVDDLWLHASGVAAVLVRLLYRTLGFDEHRVFKWRLDHKLVQALVLRHYLADSVPFTVGLTSISAMSGCESVLQQNLAALFPNGLFLKASLGDSSGDEGPILRVVDQMAERLTGNVSYRENDLTEERWLLQDRLSITREYRVHTIEQHVVPDLTFNRYGPGGTPCRRDAVNAYLQDRVCHLPRTLLDQTICGWDIGELTTGELCIIEVNFSGFHPVFRPGFQCSGFFRDEDRGCGSLALLCEFAERVYGVKVDVTSLLSDRDIEDREWIVEVSTVLDLLRGNRRCTLSGSVRDADVMPIVSESEDTMDCIIYVPSCDEGRVELLLETMDRWFAIEYRVKLIAGYPAADSQARLKSLGYECICEYDLVPMLQAGVELPWRLRMELISILASSLVEAAYYIVIPPDAICVNDVTRESLLYRERAYARRYLAKGQRRDYQGAERLLGITRLGWSYDSLPTVFSTDAVNSLTGRFADSISIDESTSDDVVVENAWIPRAIHCWPWSASRLYFLHLENCGSFEKYHEASPFSLTGNSVWDIEDLASWRAALSYTAGRRFIFTILANEVGVPAEAVRAQLIMSRAQHRSKLLV